MTESLAMSNNASQNLAAYHALTPDMIVMLQTVADTGSFAAAARQLRLVPSALSYRIRQLEDALDVLLFDRRGRQSSLTDAGRLLLRDGADILDDLDSLARRVRRVATGWEAALTIACDTIIDTSVVLDLCDAFYALNPPTQLKLRQETLSGTFNTLGLGLADLAIGVSAEIGNVGGFDTLPLGTMRFVFAVAPHHPLADADEALTDAMLREHRAVAVADSTHRGKGHTVGLLSGQPVLTVPDMRMKLRAQLRGLGVGFLPEPYARPWIDAGHLVEKRVQRAERQAPLSYAWRTPQQHQPGKALQWWLKALSRAPTRKGLLGRR